MTPHGAVLPAGEQDVPPDKKLQPQGEDFRPLRELLPLAAPLAMSIDSSEVCNFRCRFCVYNQSRQKGLNQPPAGARPRMEMEVFRKLVADLKAFPAKVEKLSMHCRGEPLLNPDIVEMIALMRDAGVANCIKISSNGSLLSREMARGILAAGIGQFVFSVEHVTPDGYREVTGGAWDDYAKIVENFRVLREERDKGGYAANLCAKILDFVSEAEKEKFRADFSPYADTLLITGLYASSRPELVDGTMGLGQRRGFYEAGLKANRQVCPEPFFFLCVDARGEVMPCWMDWSNGLALGNIMETPLLDIWNGKRLRDFRLLQLEGRRRENAICRDCQFVCGAHPQSDIDAEADGLAKVYRYGRRDAEIPAGMDRIRWTQAPFKS
jgi:radical SAM protein with 4Fe4S-binding SPASM domain